MLGLAEVARLVGETDRAKEYLSAAKRLVVHEDQQQCVRFEKALVMAETGQLGLATRMLREIATQTRPPNGSAWLWRRATLHAAQIYAGYGTPERPERNVVRGLIRDVERALRHAAQEAPVLVLALEASLSWLLALGGRLERAGAFAKRVMDRFTMEGTVHEDEPPRLLYAHALTLERVGASRNDVNAAFIKAIQQLDLIASRLERNMRERYLDRPMARSLLRAASQAGLRIRQDKRSFRLNVS